MSYTTLVFVRFLVAYLEALECNRFSTLLETVVKSVLNYYHHITLLSQCLTLWHISVRSAPLDPLVCLAMNGMSASGANCLCPFPRTIAGKGPELLTVNPYNEAGASIS